MDHLDRFISVIFSADIIAYTSMMERDEEEALLHLKHFEESVRTQTIAHEGEIVKTYGDGVLLLFPSAVNAIRCAINIQKSLRREPTVALRIGLHIGEIIRKDQDIFGDGVNITSRIQSMGIENSVLISSDVYTQIKNKSEFKIVKLGLFSFKNVKESILVYALQNGDLTVPEPKEMSGKGTLKKIGSWKPVKIILGTLLILAASLTVYNFFSPESTPVKLTSDLIALDFYLKGEFYQKKENPDDIDSAIVYYNKAIKQDPGFAKAYSNLASAYMRKYLSYDPEVKWEREAYSAAGKALSIDARLANPHLIRGQFFWSPNYDFAHEEAIREFKKAISNDPQLSQAYEQLSLVQLHIGLFEEAMVNAKKSIDLDPENFRARRFLGEAELFQGNYETSMKEFEKIPENFAPHPTQSFKALNWLYLNKPEKAKNVLDKYLVQEPNNPNLNSVYAVIYASEGKFNDAQIKKEIAIENSRNYIHAHHIYYNLGLASAKMGLKKEATEWLEKAAETGFPNYPLFKSDPYLKNLKNYPEYEELLLKLKEKWEYFKTM